MTSLLFFVLAVALGALAGSLGALAGYIYRELRIAVYRWRVEDEYARAADEWAAQQAAQPSLMVVGSKREDREWAELFRPWDQP